MVAYSFKAQFEEAISTLGKRQTVRGHRKRHALPGEPVQLFVAMRTKACRKLLTPDPICVDVRPIAIAIDIRSPRLIASIEIAGVVLSDDEIDAFAHADGFGMFPDARARRQMGQFWLKAHPGIRHFDGVVIRWEPVI